jgi:hypothetical protein
MYFYLYNAYLSSLPLTQTQENSVARFCSSFSLKFISKREKAGIEKITG